MSGMPADIENAAVSAMRHMDLGDTAYGYNGLRIRKAVAAAILAERQRCADVAISYFQGQEYNGGQRAAGASIYAAILAGETP
ncbi:hypothetical protein ACFOLL_12480 [Falsochrobactrum ovis]|uniref:Uncharacterized protein n=1 Tax=Falsochrobactrum ovis TaxID=1293442 RepID=A0A364JSW8_9HYPH|nr:hypothetical protein [Falsochrobactrum ovis]RAK26404.1 hypothetical protein C7374_11490 [Falsochrobactrum ovis]